MLTLSIMKENRMESKHMKLKKCTKLAFSFLLACSLLAGCSSPSIGISGNSAETDTEYDNRTADGFDSFLNDLFCTELADNTINLHFTLTDPESFGIADAAISLGDLSDQSISEANANLENTLSALEKFDYDSLDTGRRLTYDVLSAYLKLQLSVADLTYYDELLRPSTGIQAQLPVLYEEYRFYDKKDVEDYLALLALTDDYFEQIIAYEQKKAAEGLFMSDFACDTVISQCEDLIADQENHYLLQTFDRRVDELTDLTDEERSDYKARNKAVLMESFFPAYRSLADAMTCLLGSGTNDMGLCYLADGKEYYQYLVAHNTGCYLDIKEIRSMIENRRISDLADITALAQENPAIMEPVTLDAMDPQAVLSLLQERMSEHFPAAPDASYTVSYIDECMEDYMAPAFYITAPIDNYSSNSIYINASTDPTGMTYFTTLAHEGFPGHLYQTVMSYNAGLPAVRSILNFPGYVEGWATYVEMISYQYAGLPEEQAAALSLNQSALLSLYASTDIGIHYDGWSFSDTVKFWSNYGITDTASLRRVYELIVEEPSHYLKYYVGYLEFLGLKETAREMYGSDYSDIAFHQAVLDIGPAPFDIVEKYLKEYYLTSVLR